MNLEAKHRELIAAVNNAATKGEWNEADAKLRGWREGVANASGDADDYGWMNFMDWHDADLHHKGKDAERPMCLGVFLDWKETHVRSGAGVGPRSVRPKRVGCVPA